MRVYMYVCVCAHALEPGVLLYPHQYILLLI